MDLLAEMTTRVFLPGGDTLADSFNLPAPKRMWAGIKWLKSFIVYCLVFVSKIR
jgi:hypothetical protein